MRTTKRISNRRNIKENLGTDYTLQVTSAYAELYEDSYTEGELDQISEWSVPELKGSYNSWVALKEAITKQTEFSVNPYICWFEEGRLDIQSDMLDLEGVPATQHEIASWKNGTERLGTARMVLTVDVAYGKHPMTSEEAKSLKIDIY